MLNTGVVNAVKVYLKLPESMPELHVSGQRFVAALVLCICTSPTELCSVQDFKSACIVAQSASVLIAPAGRLLGRLLLENLQYSFDVYLTDPQQDHLQVSEGCLADEQMQHVSTHMPVACHVQTSLLQVVRFWMQHTLKLMSAHPQTVHSHLEGFVSAAQSLFNLLHSARCSFAETLMMWRSTTCML